MVSGEGRRARHSSERTSSRSRSRSSSSSRHRSCEDPGERERDKDKERERERGRERKHGHRRSRRHSRSHSRSRSKSRDVPRSVRDRSRDTMLSDEDFSRSRFMDMHREGREKRENRSVNSREGESDRGKDCRIVTTPLERMPSASVSVAANTTRAPYYRPFPQPFSHPSHTYAPAPPPPTAPYPQYPPNWCQYLIPSPMTRPMYSYYPLPPHINPHNPPPYPPPPVFNHPMYHPNLAERTAPPSHAQCDRGARATPSHAPSQAPLSNEASYSSLPPQPLEQNSSMSNFQSTYGPGAYPFAHYSR